MKTTRTIMMLSVLLIQLLTAVAQERTISGQLLDPETNEPLPGVNITVKGTNIGTVTDLNGRYSITAPVGSTLVYSYVGYLNEEVVVQPLSEKEQERQEELKVYSHTIPDGKGKTLSPYFFVRSDNPEVDKLPLKNTSVEVNVAGVIADVKVQQLYVNAGNNKLEAIYIFPGSTSSAVYAMSMKIGNRILHARIKEKQQARQVYEEAKKQGKTATLLEQERPNVFKMNVANIFPGDSIMVEMKYTEMIKPLDGIYEFVYPTVVGPRYANTPATPENSDEEWVENPYLKEGEPPTSTFHLKVNINAGMSVRKVACPSHDILVNYHDSSSLQVKLNKAEKYGGNRDFILRYGLRGNQVESGLLLHEHGDENYFLLMMEPPERITRAHVPPREYIFIVDVSGSMHGFPLNTAKKLMNNLLTSLSQEDRFNIMLFAGGSKVLFDEPAGASERNLARALEFMSNARGGGGTELLPALKKALFNKADERYSRNFVVITDGFVNVEKEAFNLVRNHLNTANLFAVGIGSSVNRYLIEGLAHAGMGEPWVVTNDREASATGKKIVDYISKPVFTNINIRFKNMEAYDYSPVVIPDVFTERPVILYGKYKKNDNGKIFIGGWSGYDYREFSFNMELASKENNQAIRYLWARDRIKYLDDYAQYYEGDNNFFYDKKKHNTSEAHKQKIIDLGLRYNLLTAYTSFVAVDSLIRDDNRGSNTVKQPLPLPRGVSNHAVGGTDNMVLTPDVSKLEEIVVVGYGTMKKSNLTGAVNSVRTEEISSSGNPVGSLIQGKAAGVEVIENSGDPGSGVNVRVRGTGSVTQTSPLYVLDGMVMDESSLENIDPQQIENIEILKSPSATALYGARAANGIILISTRKANYGLQVILKSSVEMTKAARLPARQEKYAQGRPVDGRNTWVSPEIGEILSWGPAIGKLSYDGIPYPYNSKGRLTREEGTMPAEAYDPYKFFRSGFTNRNFAGIQYRIEKHDISITFSNENQGGIIPHSRGLGNQVMVSLKNRWFEKFQTTANFNLGEKESSWMTGETHPGALLFSLYATPPSFDLTSGTSPGKAASNISYNTLPGGGQRTYSPLASNPYWLINEKQFLNASENLTGNFSMKYMPWNWLGLTPGIKYTKKHNRLYQSALGFVQHQKEQYSSLYPSFNIDINKYFRSIDFNMQIDYYGIMEELNYAGRLQVSSESLPAREIFSNTHNFHLSTRVGIKNFINLHASANKMYAGLNDNMQEYAFTPAGGISLKLTHIPGVHLPYFNNINIFVNSGKAYMLPGISNLLPLYSYGMYDASEISYNLYRKKLVLPGNLLAENTMRSEAGIDMGLFYNKLSLSGAIFSGKSTDQMIPVHSLNHEEITLINGGDLKTRGWESSLSYNTSNASLHYRAGINITRQKTVVENLPGGLDYMPLTGFREAHAALVKNSPYGVIVGTAYQRDKEGQLVIDDDGFPVVAPGFQVIGDPTPDWIAGVENTIRYKGLELNALVDIKKGGDVWNGTRATMDYLGVSAESGNLRNTAGHVFDGVLASGGINNIPVDFADPSAGINQNRWYRYGFAGVGEENIEDGSWIKLQEVSLSYTLNGYRLSKWGIDRVKLTLSGRNLLTITGYKGSDPETMLTTSPLSRGLDYFNMPGVKRYGISMKIIF